jgi:endoglucanase
MHKNFSFNSVKLTSMKVNTIISIFLVIFFLGSLQVNAQHFLSTNGQAIVNENQDTILLRGMGLGGWMVQEGYMLQTASFANPQHEIKETIQELIGEENTEMFYEAWLNNHVRKSDIDSLKSWGFNSVRLPMHYNLFTLPIEEEPVPGEHTWLTKGFELTDSLINWCKQNEMYVILDLHASPGGQGYDAAISDYDPSKPSLWESEDNRDKMVALWKNLAERYADEQWVAGYDLLNEPNWDLPGNVALKNLYVEVTDSIRSVDPNHIIFIEGNWFANDFTGLTPPWDDNLVYSPHKYWSNNDQGSIQWVLNIRNQYNVPLWLGESGENSNVWFRDAIRLLEDNDIGWAWWPMKKIESIAGPLSVIKTEGYQTLLDYWNGSGPMPDTEFATEALMEITEGLKIENCIFQKDVIDAMFRQVYSDEAIPFNTQDIPGVVYASDFDMGVNGSAYYDNEWGNYSISTGNYTPWNNGWAYRNDAVDIERCMDDVNTNGYNIGWLYNDEWMQYDVNVTETGVYDVHIRAASGGSGGLFHFSMDGADISTPYFIPPTGGWQNWETVILEDVILNSDDKKLIFYVDEEGYNLSSFEFILTGEPTTSIPARFVSAVTVDEYSIQLNLNKGIEAPLPDAPAGFEIRISGNLIPISDVTIDPDNPRIINFNVDFLLKSTHNIKISYAGNEVVATDGTFLDQFTNEDVRNTLFYVHPVPGRIEAEDFFSMSGVELEENNDMGEGQHVGYLDPGDYLDYEINVASGGVYNVAYRTASLNGNGALELQVIDEQGDASVLQSINFSPTGGWTSFQTTDGNILLSEGRKKIRLMITQAPFNLNWFEFSPVTSTTAPEETALKDVKLFPNPGNGIFNLNAELNEQQDVLIEWYYQDGRQINSMTLEDVSVIQETIPLGDFPNGYYLLTIRLEDGTFYSDKLVKIRN